MEERDHNIAKVPSGLFARIITRLGLEKQLAVIKRYLGFSIAGLMILFVLFTFALIGFRAIMDETSFGPFLSLVVSDPAVAMRYWQTVMLSFFELMPGINLALVFTTIAFIMISVRLVVVYSEKRSFLMGSIRKQKYNQNDK